MRMIFGAIGGMKTGRGNRSTRRKPTPTPLCPPQNPTWQTRSRTPDRSGGKSAANRLSYGAAFFSPISSPLTTRRFTVEVFDPASTWITIQPKNKMVVFCEYSAKKFRFPSGSRISRQAKKKKSTNFPKILYREVTVTKFSVLLNFIYSPHCLWFWTRTRNPNTMYLLMTHHDNLDGNYEDYCLLGWNTV
jgi:hypothetical protein